MMNGKQNKKNDNQDNASKENELKNISNLWENDEESNDDLIIPDSNNNNNDIIELNSDIQNSDNFVEIGHSNKHKIWRAVKTTFFLIGLTIFTAILVFIAYFWIDYTIVPVKVESWDYKLGNYYVISKNYNVNINNVKVGDYVLFNVNNRDILPITYDYEIGKVTYIQGSIYTVDTPTQKNLTIYSSSIAYIYQK